MMCSSPFIIKLYQGFSEAKHFRYLMELAIGGELKYIYHARRLFGSERHTRFYVSGCVYALEHMHERNIIFRDVKPENMLLTERGHFKLADFGVAKVCEGKTFTVCGTPEYAAPEVLEETGHTNAADWWSLGVTTFELMTGQRPFRSRWWILKGGGINEVRFPRQVQGACESFVKGLCSMDPSQRLPIKNGGGFTNIHNHQWTTNIQNHEWFTDFDWQAMLDMTLELPYKPLLHGKADTSNFPGP